MAIDHSAAIRDELVLIRKLIVFSLLNAGVSQEKVAAAIGVDRSQVSRMFAKSSKPKTEAPRRSK